MIKNHQVRRPVLRFLPAVWLLLTAGGCSTASWGERLEIYPAAGCTTTSSVFSLTANERPVDVIHFTDYHYAHFSFAGQAALRLTASEVIRDFDISPHSLKAHGKAEGRTLSLTIRSGGLTPNYLVIQVNDLDKMVILADPPEYDVPPPVGEGIFNAALPPYSADSTGARDATPALQKAVDDAGSAGGGVVYVPPGVYKITRTLMLASDGVSLYLAGGAVIKASESREDYEGNDFVKPVLQVRKASSVSIRGRGVIDASGFALFDKDINEETNKFAGRRGVIRAEDCLDYSLEGITVKDGTSWTCTVYRSEHTTIRNVKVLNYKDVAGYKIQNDGINVCACRHAHVDRCFVMTIDDPLCCKATHESFPVYDVLMTNNVLFTSCAGQKSGMQAHSTISDLWFVNNDIVQCRRGIVVEATTGNAPMFDIHFIDVRVEKHIPSSSGPVRNIDFLARTSSAWDVELSRVTFEEEHERRFSISRPHRVAEVRMNDVRAGDSRLSSLDQFRRVGDGDLEDISFGGEAAASTQDFEDVREHWCREHVEALALRRIVRGVTESHFEPNRKLTRGDWILLLTRTLGPLGFVGGDGFRHGDPIPRGEMIALAEDALRCAGLADDVTDWVTEGQPSESVTRAQAAVLAERILRHRVARQANRVTPQQGEHP